MKENKITLKDLRKARQQLNQYNACPKCKTGKDTYVVAGYMGMFCRCQAQKLAKTKIAQDTIKDILQELNENVEKI